MAWKVWTSAIYGLMTKCTALFEPAVRSVLESENWTIWERKKEEDIQIFIGLLGRGRYISKWLPYFLRITNRLQGSRLTVANLPQTSKNSILASGFCASLAILASENLWALEAQRKPFKTKFQIVHKTKLNYCVHKKSHESAFWKKGMFLGGE